MAVTESDLRPQGLKNVHNFLMTVRKMSWACDIVAKMLLIRKKIYFLRYDRPTILYGVSLFQPLWLEWSYSLSGSYC